MTRYVKFKGFVIGQVECGEKDKSITLLTDKRGKIRTIAKGIRRISSKRIGTLETGNLIKGSLYFSHDRYILGEVELITQLSGLRTNLILSGSTLFMCELAERLLPENQANHSVFELFERSISDLEKSRKVETVVLYEVELLRLLGYGVSEALITHLKNCKWRLAQKVLNKELEKIIENKFSGLSIFLN